MEPKVKRMKSWHPVPMSEMASNTFNPIRSIVDGMKITPNPKKPMIALSIGKEKLHSIHRILRNLQIYGAGRVSHG
jgi:hypothetical protein